MIQAIASGEQTLASQRTNEETRGRIDRRTSSRSSTGGHRACGVASRFAKCSRARRSARVLALGSGRLAWKMRHGKLRPYAALTVDRRHRGWCDRRATQALERQRGRALSRRRARDRRGDLDGGRVRRVGSGRGHGSRDARGGLAVGGDGARRRRSQAREARRCFGRCISLVPLALAGVAFIARAPLPPAPIVATDPGTTKMQIAEVDGLEKVIKLAQLDRARRSAARAPRQDREGRREAQRGSQQGPREARGAGPDREARRSRSRRSASRSATASSARASRARSRSSRRTTRRSDAAKALGDHDLETMDQEMEKIANAREKQDRELAKKSLEDAADAAREERRARRRARRSRTRRRRWSSARSAPRCCAISPTR